MIDFNKYPLPKRFRHHTAANLYMPLSELKEASSYYPPVYDKIDWKEIFLNGRQPDILDIGCGKGALLFEYALNKPDENILGIEVRIVAVQWIKEVYEGEKIPNCAALWYSVVNSLNFIESNSIKKIFYLFPDPWPKRKHIKRRAFSVEFLNEAHRVLVDGGEIYLATDVEEVDEHHRKVLDEHKGFDYRYIDNDSEWNLPITNKERFCRRENIPFTRIICRKIKE